MKNEEEKVTFLRKKFALIQLINKIKLQNENKYGLINIYYFFMKSAMRNFIKEVSSRLKENHLYRLMLTFNYATNCRNFFRSCKMVRTEKNNFLKRKIMIGNVTKIYKNKLIRKVFRAYKSLKIRNEKHNMIICKLSRKYEYYLGFQFLHMLKKIKNQKYLDLKIRKIIFVKVLNYFKKVPFIEYKSLEYDRLIRKFSFHSMRIQFIKKITKILTQSQENKKKFYRKLRIYFLKQFLRRLKSKLNILKTKRNFKSFHHNQVIKLLKRRNYHLRIYLSKFLCLSKSYDKAKISKFFKKIIGYSYDLKIEEEDKRKKLFLILFIKLLTKRNSINQTINTKLKKFSDLKNRKGEILNSIHIFKKFNIYQKKNFRAIEKNETRLLTKTYKSLKVFHDNMGVKKEKYILSLLFFRRNFIKKAFASLKLNRIIEKEEKEEYEKLKEERNRLISQTMFKKLITYASNKIKNKEEQMTKVYIQRTTRGVSTALKWFNKLKSRVQMKKINSKISTNKTTYNAIHNQINNTANSFVSLSKPKFIPQNLKSNSNTTSVQQDVDLLIQLKNKKREIPKKLQF